MSGHPITDIGPMREALASYMHRATEKMRRQGSMTGMVRVGIRTSFFGNGPKYSQAVTLQPPYPTDDVRLLTTMAVDALPAIWRDGCSRISLARSSRNTGSESTFPERAGCLFLGINGPALLCVDMEDWREGSSPRSRDRCVPWCRSLARHR